MLLFLWVHPHLKEFYSNIFGLKLFDFVLSASFEAFLQVLTFTDYNYGKNICTLFHALAQSPFTTNEKGLDYYH